MYTNKLVALFLITNLSWAAAQGQQKSSPDSTLNLSLTDVWHMADSYDKTNQIKKIQVDEQKENILDAKAERLPDISASGNFEEASDLPIYNEGIFSKPVEHTIVHTRYKVGVDGFFNLYSGNKANLKIAEQSTLKELETIRQQATAAEIRLLAAAYYLDLKKSYIFKSLIVKNIENQEKQLAKIKVFLEQGTILKSDFLRAQLKLSNQKMLLLQVENDIIIGSQKLDILTGQTDKQLILPTDSLHAGFELKTADDYSKLLTNAYDNRLANKESSLTQIKLKNIKANVSLKVGLYSSFQYAYPETFLYPYSANIYSLGVAGIKVSYPLSGYYTNAHKQKIAALEVEKQQILTADVEDKLRQRLNEAYLRYKEALVKVDVAKTNVSQAAENYRIVRNSYFNQASLITDLLDADVQLLQTNFDLVSAQATAQLHYYQLQNVLGTL